MGKHNHGFGCFYSLEGPHRVWVYYIGTDFVDGDLKSVAFVSCVTWPEGETGIGL